MDSMSFFSCKYCWSFFVDFAQWGALSTKWALNASSPPFFISFGVHWHRPQLSTIISVRFSRRYSSSLTLVFNPSFSCRFCRRDSKAEILFLKECCVSFDMFSYSWSFHSWIFFLLSVTYLFVSISFRPRLPFTSSFFSGDRSSSSI